MYIELRSCFSLWLPRQLTILGIWILCLWLSWWWANTDYWRTGTNTPEWLRRGSWWGVQLCIPNLWPHLFFKLDFNFNFHALETSSLVITEQQMATRSFKRQTWLLCHASSNDSLLMVPESIWWQSKTSWIGELLGFLDLIEEGFGGQVCCFLLKKSSTSLPCCCIDPTHETTATKKRIDSIDSKLLITLTRSENDMSIQKTSLV